jgi:hypothetical protein
METVHHFTDKELRAAIEAHVRPLEEKAFAAGVRAAEDAVLKQVTLEALVKNARAGGVLSPNGAAVAVGKSPEDLAKRANEIQRDALRDGREVSNIDAVRAAYAEAGIPWK